MDKSTFMATENSFNRVEDFDVEVLRKAFNEGRLFIKPQQKSEAEIREEGIKTILQYVKSIDACASQEHHAHIQTLWNIVLHHESLQPLCFMTKGRHRGEPNWYRITSIVCLLREMNVYRKQDFTAVDLHLLLEGISKRNSRYQSSTHYYLDHPQIMILKKILSNLKNSEE